VVEIEVIVAIVERGKADKLVDAAKAAGARGATIFYGRGTGANEAKRLFNLHIDSAKEVILTLVEKDKVRAIKEAMVEAGELRKPGTGIIFTLPVSSVIGLTYRED